MSYAYTIKQIVCFKRLHFMLWPLLCASPWAQVPGLWRVCVGVTCLSPFCRLLIDMVPRVRQTRHYEMFEWRRPEPPVLHLHEDHQDDERFPQTVPIFNWTSSFIFGKFVFMGMRSAQQVGLHCSPHATAPVKPLRTPPTGGETGVPISSGNWPVLFSGVKRFLWVG